MNRKLKVDPALERNFWIGFALVIVLVGVANFQSAFPLTYPCLREHNPPRLGRVSRSR
jgi:hypothetical protein